MTAVTLVTHFFLPLPRRLPFLPRPQRSLTTLFYLMDSDDDLDHILNGPSSPLRPPQAASDDTTPTSPSQPGASVDGNTANPAPESSTPAADPPLTVTPNARKRPAEDFTQLANGVARKIKLSPQDRESLTRYSTVLPTPPVPSFLSAETFYRRPFRSKTSWRTASCSRSIHN